MATFMERLQKSSRFADGNAPSYLRSHPITYERIAEAQARAYGKPYRQVPDSLDFHLVRALLRSYTGTDREAVTYFDDGAGRAQVQQPGRDALRPRRRAAARQGRQPRAKPELATLEKIAPPHPMIDAMAGHVLHGVPATSPAAIARFESALARTRTRCSWSTTTRRRC